MAALKLPRETVGTTSELFTYDLPLDFHSKLPAQVDAVTPRPGARRQAVFRSGKDVRSGSRRQTEDLGRIAGTQSGEGAAHKLRRNTRDGVGGRWRIEVAYEARAIPS